MINGYCMCLYVIRLVPYDVRLLVLSAAYPATRAIYMSKGVTVGLIIKFILNYQSIEALQKPNRSLVKGVDRI